MKIVIGTKLAQIIVHVNEDLAKHGLRFIDDGQQHDGFSVYELEEFKVGVSNVEKAEIVQEATECNCKWPDVRYRNGSGHSEDCPAHQRYLAKMKL